MTLESNGNIFIRSAERLLELRAKQRENFARGGKDEGNTLFIDDEQIKAIDEREREFQKDFPVGEGDLLAMGEYGGNEAALPQVSARRIESLAAKDQSGIGDSERGSKVFDRARRDLLPQKIGAFVETPSGKEIFVTGENAPNERVAPELREATIIQELGLAKAEQNQRP